MSEEPDRIKAEIASRLDRIEGGPADEVYARIEGCCNACRFYDRTGFGDVNYGECRRHPPVMVKEQANGIPRGVWSVVGYDDFCGEYEAG
jgi:hypothetical protein